MKKTLSILAVAALSLGATTSYAKDIVLRPYGDVQSRVESVVLPNAATLINSETGKVVVYDTVKQVSPPFDITKGLIQWDINLNDRYNEFSVSLDDVAITADDDKLVLDFSYNMGQLSGPTGGDEYMVIMFHGRKDPYEAGYAEWYSTINDFAEWYSTNEVPIIGRFTNGDYLAYVIDDTCDKLVYDEVNPNIPNSSSTIGGLVFFNKSVAPAVLDAEVDPDTITPTPEPDPEPSPSVPEPTTATLSLLALAGLAARRRRR